MFNRTDYQYMSRALHLAERGLYTTDPNPRVGCVLARDGEVVGEGWHERAGEPHAEVHALRDAGERARGATAYVTLEPCCHHGRTPPCSEALVEAGVVRVVAAMQDPNPRVAGQGLRQLSEAGLDVAAGLLEAQAEALNPGFVMRMRHGRPFVRCKLAMSLDGRTAMASGESQWITGEAARADVHRLRARSSAILSGIGTVLSDDPSLTARPGGPAPPGGWLQPLRVILDPHLSTPPTAGMLTLPGRTLIVTTTDEPAISERLREGGADVVVLPGRGDSLDLQALLECLAEREVNEALLETGATLSGAMLRAGLIDELVLYMAPHLMGDGARGLFHLPALEQMAQRIELDIRDIRAVGGDWRISAGVKT
ncbi:MAG: bifunctional diaminohydroxyphosphoribosylaminopyrimidine deaminase/5-amino-6-(5-phosphoribosylamino)uracil reductase RibD [Gammaproteobacteria bacterium]